MIQLSPEEITGLKRIADGLVAYQGGVYVSADAPDLLFNLPTQTISRIMGRLAGSEYGLAEDQGGTLALNDAGKRALVSGFRQSG